MTSYSTLTISRRHLLGDLNKRCDQINDVPVYLENETGERVGFASEPSDTFADSVTFHLSPELCKKLSTGHYSCSVGYDFADAGDPVAHDRRVKLDFICLCARKVTTG